MNSLGVLAEPDTTGAPTLPPDGPYEELRVLSGSLTHLPPAFPRPHMQTGWEREAREGAGEKYLQCRTVLVIIFLPAVKSIHSFIQFTFLSPWATLGAEAAKTHSRELVELTVSWGRQRVTSCPAMG